MKIRYKFTIIFLILFAAASTVFFLVHSHRENSPTLENSLQSDVSAQDLNIKQSSHMKIKSSAFENNANIPTKFTCDGQNINPALTISGVPVEAKSLALIVDDPDAPAAGGFVHWVVFNFDPKTTEIAENSFPVNAIQGQNGAGQSRYTGPCPPSGTHHYHFKLFALDTSLNLSSSAKRENVEQAMSGHIVDQTDLIGLYKRP